MNEDTSDKLGGHITRLLSNAPKFEILSDDELRDFVDVGQIRTYEAGEILMQEGQYDCWFHILIAGQLEVTKGDKVIGYMDRVGDLLGEMGVIDGSPRSATIKTVSKCTLIGFDASYIEQKLKSNDVSFCYAIYRMFSEVLSARLRDVTKENVELRRALSRFGNS